MTTRDDLQRISKSKRPKASLVNALLVVLDRYKPHVQAHLLAQVMHESGGLTLDREIWGPTAAQQRYEGRKDLGNTQKGDGSKFRGYGPIQLTGRGNITAFYAWCKKQGLNPPDFTQQPELVAVSPWAGWSTVWYWEVGNPTRKSLTVYADENNIEMITRRVNGGLNGYDDRLSYYDRSALVLLGYGPAEVKRLQTDAGLEPDGVSGPQTRAAMHRQLVGQTPGEAQRPEVKASPIVENTVTTEAVPITAPSADAPWYKSKEVIVPLVTGGGLSTIGGTMQSFGSLPIANLIVLLVFGFGVLAAVLYVLKKKDQKIVQAQVAAVNAANAGQV